MVKILIIQWIINNCDKKTFIGMRWHDRDKGIFWLYWKHQSSRSCKENTAESTALYEYYRAWARHKNNNRRRQPRDLKAAFRNALEKKPELERLTHMETTKDRIYWRIKNFPNGQNESCAPTQPPVKKPKVSSNRGRKPSNNLFQNSGEFPVNFGASTSTAGEDVTPERKRPRKPPIKRSRKICGKTQKSSTNEGVVSVPYEIVDGFSKSHEVANNQTPLPSFGIFKGNDHDNGSWDDSLKNTDSNFSSQSPHFLETSYEKQNAEEVWTPQFFPHTPPQLSSDLMEVSSTEMMDLLIPNQRITYSFQPTPPQETTDILLDNHADLLTLLDNGGEPTILKYSFPFQPEEVTTSPSHLTNTHLATSLHCSPSDFASLMKTSNVQSNNCVLDSTTTPLNAFLFDQKQCSYDQVVPPYSEAFQTSKQLADASEILLYSPPPVANHGQIFEEMCHQQADTGFHSSELFKYNNQTSHDDSRISDLEDFLDCANKLLDDFGSQCDEQCHQMC
ncbi:hypothetical protein AVEN_83678-2 [Araneus ventricosus]|uniref:IRF tryptophan pentad repeat domain-containing protein n=1 Tax=Araneus ventricosus TaxID=182803 RepID=A0A4Y2EY03_ARAVE|nr:hypothetical protein AVEN_83678-2 [Araneus ventricosus]